MHTQAGAPLVLSLVTKSLLASALIIHLQSLLLSLASARNVTRGFLLYLVRHPDPVVAACMTKLLFDFKSVM